MAISQKHVGKSVVPWFCGAEWNIVYTKIYGPNENENSKIEALNILNIWKSRSSFLPRGVEGTYIILNAILLDRNMYEDYSLLLLLSSSIMRFLNICAAYDKNQGSFTQTAFKRNLPEWLISLRHEIAHSQSLPSIDMLDRALSFSLEWLHTDYWIPMSMKIKDYIVDSEVESDEYEKLKTTLQPLVSTYCYTILVTHPFWNFLNIKDIFDTEARLSFLEEIKSLTKLNDIHENTSFKKLQKILWKNIGDILNDSNNINMKANVLSELLIEDIFLGTFDESTEIFQNFAEIPQQFLILWGNLLIEMHRLNMIGPLIEKLHYVLTNEFETYERKMVASLWLLEIGKGFLKSIHVNDIKNELKNENVPKHEMKYKLEEILTEKYKDSYILDLKFNFPDVVTDNTKFKKIFLENPTEYSKIFISHFLELNDKIKHEENKSQILELINIYVPEETKDSVKISPKVHTVEDILNMSMEIEEQKENNESEKEKIESKKEDIEKTKPSSNFINERWRKITEFNFEKIPIGILPWQDSSMNPLLL